MGKYDDIINLPHHVSDYHTPMPIENRAAQFAPFAALNGHDEAIAEIARLTEKRKDLSEEEITLLSKKLYYALEKEVEIKVKYFIPDNTKSGGNYQTVSGTIKKWNEIEQTLLMKDDIIIPINLIADIILQDESIEI